METAILIKRPRRIRLRISGINYRIKLNAYAPSTTLEPVIYSSAHNTVS